MTIETSVALIKQKVDGIKEDMKSFVTDDEFEPVKKIVYGLVGIILTSVIIAIVTLVVNK